MYYAFVAPDVPLPKRRNRYVYFIRVDKFMQEEYDQAFDSAWAKRYVNKILTDKKMQYSQHIFSLSIIGAGGWELFSWVQEYEKHWDAVAKQAKEDGDEQADLRHFHSDQQ